MAMRDRQPGDKLLPKVMQAVIQTVIGTNVGLTGHKYNLGVNVGQELIDRMGREVADLFRPLLDSALNDSELKPETREFMEKALSGEHQWQAVAGKEALLATSQSAIGSILNNALFPLVGAANRVSPSLAPDPGTLAQLYASNFVQDGNYNHWMNSWGLQDGWAEAMRSAASTYPNIGMIQDLRNREFVTDEQAYAMLQNQGVPPGSLAYFENLWGNVLTVQDAALAVLRTDITKNEGLAIARQNGYGPDDFEIFLSNTGEPPGAQELMEALRRGYIDEATFRTGIAQSRVRNQWQDTLLDLRYSPLATADAVNAYVEGYVSEDTVKSVANANGLEPEQYKILIEAAGDPLSYTDMMRLWRYQKATEDDVKAALKRGRLKDDYIDFALALKDSPMSVADAIEASIQGYLSVSDAKAIALMNGLREQDFDALQKTAGDPASRTEMIQLWRRGLVTQAQVEDALRQSRLKDAYIPDVLNLKVQLPALYEVRALLASGGLSTEQGTQILLAQGYEADIVKGIVSNAVGETSASTKALTEAMYVSLYNEQAITSQQFTEALTTLGYSQTDSSLILEIQDNKLAITQRNGVITKVKAGYVGHRINEATAQSELNQLGIPAEMVDRLISDWDLIIETDVKLLTPAQVADAWQMQFFNQNDPADNITQALDYLANLGYSGPDALIILEIKAKGLLDSGTGSPKVSASATTSSTQASSGGQ
jgi:hypothetical protein